METGKIKIAIVDDHALLRNGVAALMREFDEIEVLYEADNGRQLQELLPLNSKPHVILMDINMPVMDGYVTTAWLKEKHPEIKVLALSMLEDDKAVIKMIKCGACGYLLKGSSPRELLEAIKIINDKGVFINELVSGKMVRSLTTDIGPPPDFTKNEVTFLQLCCTELIYKEIADEMFISPRTVENYRDALYQKTNVKSRTGLILYAIQNEIVKL